MLHRYDDLLNRCQPGQDTPAPRPSPLRARLFGVVMLLLLAAVLVKCATAFTTL